MGRLHQTIWREQSLGRRSTRMECSNARDRLCPQLPSSVGMPVAPGPFRSRPPPVYGIHHLHDLEQETAGKAYSRHLLRDYDFRCIWRIVRLWRSANGPETWFGSLEMVIHH